MGKPCLYAAEMSYFKTSMIVWRQMNIERLRSEGIIHKKSSPRKIILSDEGNEAQYLVFISVKLVFTSSRPNVCYCWAP